jgi:hypothetical protein
MISDRVLALALAAVPALSAPKCDKRVVERLTRECLRDGGRP